MGTVEGVEVRAETAIIEEDKGGMLLEDEQVSEDGDVTVTTPVTDELSPEGEVTYSTSLNVANVAKPHLIDYNATLSTVTNPPIETLSTTAASRQPAYVIDDSDYESTTAAISTEEATVAVTTTTTVAETTTTKAEETTTTEEETTADTSEETTTAVTTTTTAETTVPETTTVADTVQADPDAANEILTVYHNTGGQNVSADAVTIISKIVQAEIGSSFKEDAIKAQAIAAYTYVKYYNDRGKVPTAALSTPTTKVTNCVKEVIGLALYYNGDYIQSVYGASTAGYTASAANVWGVNYPYLVSKYCELDAMYDPNYGVKKTFTATEMQSMVYSATGIYLDGDPAGWFAIKGYVDNVYVGEMTIGGYSTYTTSAGSTKKITGRVLRETIMNYKLKSTCFELDYDSTTGKFTFTTYGYGHCVGLSQHGANNLATYWGYDYKQILEYYFPGTTLK